MKRDGQTSSLQEWPGQRWERGTVSSSSGGSVSYLLYPGTQVHSPSQTWSLSMWMLQRDMLQFRTRWLTLLTPVQEEDWRLYHQEIVRKDVPRIHKTTGQTTLQKWKLADTIKIVLSNPPNQWRLESEWSPGELCTLANKGEHCMLWSPSCLCSW